jgi:hypothetical protein
MFACMGSADWAQGSVAYEFTYVAARVFWQTGHEYALGMADHMLRDVSRPLSWTVALWSMYVVAVMSLACGFVWAKRRFAAPAWWRVAVVCCVWLYSPVPMTVLFDPSGPPLNALLFIAVWAIACHGMLLLVAPPLLAAPRSSAMRKNRRSSAAKEGRTAPWR